MDIRNIIFLKATNLGDLGIKIQVNSLSDHKALTELLREKNFPYHTYQRDDERELRVVIRGVPHEITADLVKADILAQGFPVRQVHRMISGKTKRPLNMVLVVLELSPAGKSIFSIKEICKLSGLVVEPPNRRTYPGQCHRCQNWGHSARNCFGIPRCVKCLNDHGGTASCPRTRDDPEPPSCVLCGQKGHPANYRGCPKAPRSYAGAAAARKPQHTPPSHLVRVPAPLPEKHFPSLPTNKVSRPAATLPQKSAPVLKAWPHSSPTVTGAAPKATSASLARTLVPSSPPAPKLTTAAGNTPANAKLLADFNVVLELINIINIDELSVLANKIRNATSAADKLHATIEHYPLLSALQHFSPSS